MPKIRARARASARVGFRSHGIVMVWCRSSVRVQVGPGTGPGLGLGLEFWLVSGLGLRLGLKFCLVLD
jgi:hypothetical protein